MRTNVKFLLLVVLLFISVVICAQVTVSTQVTNGIEMRSTPNLDGTATIKCAFKWYAGFGSSTDASEAMRMAYKDAYIRAFDMVEDAFALLSSTKGVNDKVLNALKEHWASAGEMLLNYCESVDETEPVYDGNTRRYNATVKIAIRADYYQSMMKNDDRANTYGLEGDDLKQFQEVNDRIITTIRK